MAYHEYGWLATGNLLVLFHDGVEVIQAVAMEEQDAYALADYINQHRSRVSPQEVLEDALAAIPAPPLPEPTEEFNVAEALLEYAKTHPVFTPKNATDALGGTGILRYGQVYGRVYRELKKNPRYTQDIETGLWSYKRGPGRPSKADKIRESAEMAPKAPKGRKR